MGKSTDWFGLRCYSGPASDLNERRKLIEGHMPPEILVHGLVTEEDVKKLFEMYVIRFFACFPCGIRTGFADLSFCSSDFMNTSTYAFDDIVPKYIDI
jgi:hypothetical protein